MMMIIVMMMMMMMMIMQRCRLGQDNIEDSNLENYEEEDVEKGAKAGEE